MELDRRSRWLALTLPVALAATAALARPAPPGALATGTARLEACGQRLPAAGEPGRGGTWYRLDAVLDARGTLSGQALTAGRGEARWTASLPPESFASGPVGGRLVVGADDGRRSALRILDTARGCWLGLADSADVVRSAVISPDGLSLIEHRVARASRADLGIWRRDLSSPDRPAERVAPGLAADAAHGPTYATSILAAPDGRLVVSSCGASACRTRVVSMATGSVKALDATGPAVGIAGDQIIALDACRELPCAVLGVSLGTGARTPLGTTDGAVVVAPGQAVSLVAEDGGGLRVRGPGRGPGGAAVPRSAGLAPLSVTSLADSGAEAPAGWAAVAPGGRVGDPSAIRFLDPATLQLTAGEVLP